MSNGTTIPGAQFLFGMTGSVFQPVPLDGANWVDLFPDQTVHVTDLWTVMVFLSIGIKLGSDPGFGFCEAQYMDGGGNGGITGNAYTATPPNGGAPGSMAYINFVCQAQTFNMQPVADRVYKVRVNGQTDGVVTQYSISGWGFPFIPVGGGGGGTGIAQVITPATVAGVQTISVPENTAAQIAVTLPVPLDKLTSLTCTVIDMDDANACAIAPYLGIDAMPWVDPTLPYVPFPLQPPASAIRWGAPNYYERRRAVFAWQATNSDGSPLQGVTVLAFDVWNIAGYPQPDPPVTCETPPAKPPVIGLGNQLFGVPRWG